MNQTNISAPKIVERRFRILIPWLSRRFDLPAETINSGGAGSSNGGNTNTNINNGNREASNRGSAGRRRQANEDIEEDLD